MSAYDNGKVESRGENRVRPACTHLSVGVGGRVRLIRDQ